MQDSSNATHEEVRNAMGRARRPSHSILPRSRAEQSLRASLDPARTYLQGGGYDSRQCRADTQLAMIGVSMRVTPFLFMRGTSPIISDSSERCGPNSVSNPQRRSPSKRRAPFSRASETADGGRARVNVDFFRRFARAASATPSTFPGRNGGDTSPASPLLLTHGWFASRR